jgi:hypothetical protein
VALEYPVDGRPRNTEQFGQIGDGVLAGGMQLHEMRLLFGRKLGLLTFEKADRNS